MIIIKRIMQILLGLLLIQLLYAAPVMGVEKILRVAGDQQYPPYEFIDAKGNYRGFNVDIIRAIAISQGFTIEFYPMEWNKAQEALLNGEVDLIQGMTYSEQRSERFDFCEPIVVNSQSIFVPRKVNTISSLDDLAGNKVSFQKGDITIEMLNKVQGIELVPYDTQEGAVQALIQGKVDAFVGNELTGWYMLEKWRRLADFKQVGENFFEKDYSPVVQKGDTATLKMINEGLKSIRDNDSYEKIYEKWFGKTYDDSLRKLESAIAVMIIISLILIAGGIIFTKINSRLKDEVDKRTAELQSFSNMQEAILLNAPNGIITLTKEGKILTVNPAARHILGREMIGYHYSKSTFLSFLNDHNIDEIFSLSYTLEKTVEYRGMYLQLTVTPIVEMDGPKSRLLVNIDNITAERRLAERAGQENKLKSLTTLVAGMAHEIRNPLTAIKTYVDLMPQKIGNELFQKRMLKAIPHEINRIEQLMQELIDYARPRQAEPQECNLKDSLGAIVEIIKSRCEAKEVDFQVKLKGEVLCDCRHLQQIVLNLLLNSLRAVPNGGKIVMVSVQTEQMIHLIIKDNGSGIPEEHQGQIFDPFFSLSGGSGLGLSLVQQMVIENGGFINFVSKVNKGTRFDVWLPVA